MIVFLSSGGRGLRPPPTKAVCGRRPGCKGHKFDASPPAGSPQSCPPTCFFCCTDGGTGSARQFPCRPHIRVKALCSPTTATSAEGKASDFGRPCSRAPFCSSANYSPNVHHVASRSTSRGQKVLRALAWCVSSVWPWGRIVRARDLEGLGRTPTMCFRTRSVCSLDIAGVELGGRGDSLVGGGDDKIGRAHV